MFLTNLPLTVTEAAIRELAKEQLDGDEADIEEIRLIRDPRGRSSVDESKASLTFN